MENVYVLAGQSQEVIMRIAAFLFALSLVTASVLPQTSPLRLASPPAQPPLPSDDGGSAAQNSSDGLRMLRRTEILVPPVELSVANRAELASLRARVAQAEVNMSRLDLSDPAVATVSTTPTHASSTELRRTAEHRQWQESRGASGPTALE